MVEQRFAVHVAGAQAAVVQVQRTVGTHHVQRVRLEAAEVVVEIEVLFEQLACDADRFLAPGHDLFDVLEQVVAFFDADVLVHAARDGAGAVYRACLR